MLYVCPTPIGNLGDITLRVLEVLNDVDLIAAEDTRHSRKLLSHYEISRPLISFFEHNEQRRLPGLMERLARGEDIALVTDAGMPGVCDPGYTLVREALEQGYEIEVLPGPSAIETALVSSGFATDSYLFFGYLPKKKGDLRKAMEEIATCGRTAVAFESPNRLKTTLNEAVTIVGMHRIAVCRELTKKFATVYRGTAAELLKDLPETIRGEIALVFEAAEATALTDLDREELEYAIRELLAEGMSTRRVSELVSYFTGAPKKKVYELTVELKEKEDL